LRAAQAARAAGKGSEGQIKAAVQQGQRQASVNAAVKSANTPSALNKPAPAGTALAAQQKRLAQKNKVTPVKPQAPSTTGSSTTPTVKTPNINLKKEERNSMERINGKGVQSLKDSYNSVYMERTEDKVIGEGIMDALKKVGKAVIGPANQSPEAEAARMGKRRPQTKQEKGVAAGTVNKEDVDLFDIIKGHLIDEGLTEEEALKKMLDLTEEEREAILDEGLAGMVGSVTRNTSC